MTDNLQEIEDDNDHDTALDTEEMEPLPMSRADARRAKAALERAEHNAKIEAVEALKVRCEAARKTRTLAYLEMLDLIGELPDLPRARKQAVIAEVFGLGRAEAGRLLKIGDLDPGFRALMVRRAVAPELVEALMRSSDAVREFALAEIASGEALDKADLRRLKTELDADKPSVVLAKKNRALESSAVEPARQRFKALKRAMYDLTSLLVRLHGAGTDSKELDQLRAQAIEAAGLRLSELEVCFGADRLAAAQSDKRNAQKVLGRLAEDQHAERNQVEAALAAWSHEELELAETYGALWQLATGDFMPGGEYDDDTDHHVSRHIVSAIAWYADYDLREFEEELDRLHSLAADYRAQYEVYADEDYPAEPLTERALTSLELCAGAGGEALGLRAAGFEALGVFEAKKSAIETLRTNFPFGPLFAGDLREIDFSAYRGQIDLLAGGVPCQPFSSLGSKKRDEDGRDLFMTAVRIAAEIRPRAVMLENVRGFSQRPGKLYVAEIISELRKAGYFAKVFPIAAEDYGLAQARPRVVVIAFREPGMMRKFRMPPVFPQWRTTVGEALSDLMGARGWPGLEAWVKKANKVGPTIVGGSDRSGSQAFADGYVLPAWTRLGIDGRRIADAAPGADDPSDMMPALTLAMGARLQGFPDAWEFQGSPLQQRRQIANAFPPIVAGALGMAIRQTLTGMPVDYEKELSPLRTTPGIQPKKWWGDPYANSRANVRAEELGLPMGVVKRDVPKPSRMRRFWVKKQETEDDFQVAAAE